MAGEEQARTTGLTDEEQESFAEHEAALQETEGKLHTVRESTISRLDGIGQKPTNKLVNDDPAVKHATKAVAAAARPATRLRKQAESRGLTADERSRLASDRKALQRLRVQRQQEPGEPSGLPLSEVRVPGKRRRERRTRNPATRAGVQQGRSRPVLDGRSHQNRRNLSA